MPEDGLDQLRRYDAIYLGAVGFPGVPDHVSLWGLLIPIRRGMEQYINSETRALLEGIESPLAVAARRTSTSGSCARTTRASTRRSAGVCTRAPMPRRCEGNGVHPARGGPGDALRIRAGAHARGKARHLGDQVQRHHSHHAVLGRAFCGDGAEYPDIRTDQYHIDILTAHFVLHPDWFDVVVGSNSVWRHSLRPRTRRWPGPSVSRRRPTSTRRKTILDVRARAWLGARTSPGEASPTPSGRSGRGP